jgi:hypothetical protein
MNNTTEDKLASLDAKLDAIIHILNDTAFAKKPNLLIKDFAQLAGKSRWTIMNDIRLGKIRKINGRIPRDQLSKYTS